MLYKFFINIEIGNFIIAQRMARLYLTEVGKQKTYSQSNHRGTEKQKGQVRKACQAERGGIARDRHTCDEFKGMGLPSLPEAVCSCGLEWLHVKLNRQVKSIAVGFKYHRYLTLLGKHKMFKQRNKKGKTPGVGKTSQETL